MLKAIMSYVYEKIDRLRDDIQQGIRQYKDSKDTTRTCPTEAKSNFSKTYFTKHDKQKRV